MFKKNRGLTLFEVMIAAMILVVAVGFFVVTYIGFESRLASYRYHYTAVNLLRDCLEFGESARFAHWFWLKYNYQPSEDRYKLTQWEYFAPGNADPFDYMGDIKSKGMVPLDYPDDVTITYEARMHNFPDTGDMYLSKATISWKENLPGRSQATYREEELSVVPITHYNDQFSLSTGRFWWERR